MNQNKDIEIIIGFIMLIVGITISETLTLSEKFVLCGVIIIVDALISSFYSLDGD